MSMQKPPPRRTRIQEKTLAFKIGTVAVAILSVIVVLYVLRFTFGVHF
jgi:hypothetical protein